MNHVEALRLALESISGVTPAQAFCIRVWLQSDGDATPCIFTKRSGRTWLLTQLIKAYCRFRIDRVRILVFAPFYRIAYQIVGTVGETKHELKVAVYTDTHVCPDVVFVDDLSWCPNWTTHILPLKLTTIPMVAIDSRFGFRTRDVTWELQPERTRLAAFLGLRWMSDDLARHVVQWL
jgi:hypothetical protein